MLGDSHPALMPFDVGTPQERRPGAPLVDPVATFVYIGEFSREHHLYNAIQAIELTRIRRVRTRLVLAGCGPQSEALRYFASTLRLGDDVRFMGPAFAQEKRELFNVADALLYLHDCDHMPYIVRDAVESGVRVVAVRKSALGDRLREGSQAIFLRAAWPHLICEAMVMVARSRRLRVSALPSP
jgi:glycosyltransferase involved in cell wall biosynthesis